MPKKIIIKKPPVEQKIKTIKTFDLKLTTEELVHMRDLFTVALPPDLSVTVSQFLSQIEDRTLHEARLWHKISSLCEAAKVPLGPEAPDYVISPISVPAMGVFRMDANPDDEPIDEQALGNILNKLSEDDDEKDIQSRPNTLRGDEQTDESHPRPSRRRSRKKNS